MSSKVIECSWKTLERVLNKCFIIEMLYTNTGYQTNHINNLSTLIIINNRCSLNNWKVVLFTNINNILFIVIISNNVFFFIKIKQSWDKLTIRVEKFLLFWQWFTSGKFVNASSSMFSTGIFCFLRNVRWVLVSLLT